MIYKICFGSLKGIGIAEKRRILKETGSFEEACYYIKNNKRDIASDMEQAKKILESCYQKGIFIKTYKEYGIPDNPELPPVLYCRGNWRDFGETIGIVGTRRCTEYGRKITSETAGKLAREGVTIISGMARGVDGYAHSAALKAGGYTVAVLGNGPDICFPSEHRSLMEAILKTGLVISEYPPGFHGNISTFPQRNRIIAAFSDRVLVVESGKKGGALITAEKAKAYGKKVYAVPGRLDSPESEGTNGLIASKKAELWLPEYCKAEETQLSFSFPENHEEDRQSAENCSKNANDLDQPSIYMRDILRCLKSAGGCMTTDELMKELKIERDSLLRELTDLEIDDLIRTEGDIIWLR